jgi:hypothetical protein
MDDKPQQLTSEELAVLSRLGQIRAHKRWSQVEDRTAATAPGRRAAEARFEREVDPDGVLDPAERARRVENARRAHFIAMAHRSVEARRKRKQNKADAGGAPADVPGGPA